MFGPLGFQELVLIFIVVLLLFGPKKLPDFAKFLGKAIREFKKTISDAKSTLEDEMSDTEISSEIKDIQKNLKEIKSATQIRFEDANLSGEPKKGPKLKKGKAQSEKKSE